MNVSAKAHVVSQVPTIVIGIVVEDDLVGIPEPIVAIAVVVRGHAEVGAIEPEARGRASRQAPHMTRTEAAREVSVYPGVIEVVVRVAASGIVSYPVIV